MGKAQKGGTDVHGNTARERGIQKSQPKYNKFSTTILKQEKEKDDYKSGAMDLLFKKQGAINIENTKMFGVTAALKPFFKWGSEKTRDYFTGKVLNQKRGFTTKLGKTIRYADWKTMKHKERESIYKSYMEGRMSGRTDAYGNVNTHYAQGDGPPQQQKQATTTGQTLLSGSPTEAEVSQSDATNAAETELTAKRIKKRGRKMNIYAQSKDKLILGKKSLLGMV